MSNQPARVAAALAIILPLGACGSMERISRIGRAPDMSPIQNPVAQKDYRPVELPMPEKPSVPAAPSEASSSNSLWQTGARSFFKDQRAGRVGDLITVEIEIADSARINNTTKRSRDNGESLGLPNFFGIESGLGKLLPEAVSPEKLVELESESTSNGAGSIQRGESINLKIAAVITQMLANGNMVLRGSQEVLVNNELRELLISGVIRPEDISSKNTITYDRIAEARIAYGGRGQLTDVQRPRYGQELYDIVVPF